jgi:hypothetical protein
MVFSRLPPNLIQIKPILSYNIGQWRQELIDNGYRSRLIEKLQILGFVEKG